MKNDKQPIGIHWCNVHQREATAIDKRGNRCCDPKLGGIMFPCNVVFIEDVEIEE